MSHQGWIFVNFPTWGDEVQFTVTEVQDGRPVAYPNLEFNQTQPDEPAAALVSVQSVVVDPRDRLSGKKVQYWLITLSLSGF